MYQAAYICLRCRITRESRRKIDRTEESKMLIRVSM